MHMVLFNTGIPFFLDRENNYPTIPNKYLTRERTRPFGFRCKMPSTGMDAARSLHEATVHDIKSAMSQITKGSSY